MRWLNGQLLASSGSCSDFIQVDPSWLPILSLLAMPATIDQVSRTASEACGAAPDEVKEWLDELVATSVLEQMGDPTVDAVTEGHLADLGHLDARSIERLQVDLGHSESLRRGLPVDAKGNPIPLLCYCAIDFLSQFDFSDRTVLEYGSGNSTRWWSERAKHVVSAENDRVWFDRLAALSLPNVTPVFCEGERELREVLTQRDLFDVIVIDHKGNREVVAREVAKKVPTSIIVLDNSEWHHGAVKALRTTSFLEVNMSGFAPCEDWIHGTTFFIAPNCELPRMRPEEPVVPVGGIHPSVRYGTE